MHSGDFSISAGAAPSSAEPAVLRGHGLTRRPTGFTLVELLVSIAIIGLLSAMALFAMISAQDSARTAKTRGLIAKLDSLIQARWDSYRTRRVPIEFYREIWTDLNGDGIADPGEYEDSNNNGGYDPGVPAVGMAAWRVEAIRELQRLELPERWNDVIDEPICAQHVGDNQYAPTNPAYYMPRPAVSRAYLEKYQAITAANKLAKKDPAEPTDEFQGAECLYLIVTTGLSDELDARQLFGEGNVGDKDRDGALEFWDAWGNPIFFLRWAPGFVSELQPLQFSGTPPSVTVDFEHAPPPADPFDPGGIYGYWYVDGTANWGADRLYDRRTNTWHTPYANYGVNRYQFTYALHPLIYSAGPDGEYGLRITDSGGDGLHYGRPPNGKSSQFNNPFFLTRSPKYSPPAPFDRKEPYGWPVLGEERYVPDNIHNHQIRAR